MVPPRNWRPQVFHPRLQGAKVLPAQAKAQEEEAPGGEEQEEAPLPDGWTMNWDPEYGEYYYWHAPTKTTTWYRPKPTEPAPAEAPESNEAEPEVRPAAEGPVLGQQRVKGRVEKWQGFFGWITPTEDLGKDLKPLLENRQDRIYVNWRDLQEGATIKAGSLVDFQLYADDNGLGAADVQLQKEVGKAPARAATTAAQRAPKDAMEALEQQWAEQDAVLGNDEPAANEAATPGVANAAETEDAPLLPGWEQIWSEEHFCFYYWHKKAKQASWERPCVPVAGGGKDDKVWEGEGAEEGASRLATPITPVISWAGKDITPLTPGGADAKMPASGNQQPSAAFRAAQASGVFLGRGWRDEGAAKDVRAAPKPALAKRPSGGPAAAQQKGAGKAALSPASAAVTQALAAKRARLAGM